MQKIKRSLPAAVPLQVGEYVIEKCIEEPHRLEPLKMVYLVLDISKTMVTMVNLAMYSSKYMQLCTLSSNDVKKLFNKLVYCDEPSSSDIVDYTDPGALCSYMCRIGEAAWYSYVFTSGDCKLVDCRMYKATGMAYTNNIAVEQITGITKSTSSVRIHVCTPDGDGDFSPLHFFNVDTRPFIHRDFFVGGQLVDFAGFRPAPYQEVPIKGYIISPLKITDNNTGNTPCQLYSSGCEEYYSKHITVTNKDVAQFSNNGTVQFKPTEQNMCIGGRS